VEQQLGRQEQREHDEPSLEIEWVVVESKQEQRRFLEQIGLRIVELDVERQLVKQTESVRKSRDVRFLM